jgi:hypothetical protein
VNPLAAAALLAASPAPTPKPGGHPVTGHPAVTHPATPPGILLTIHTAFVPLVLVASGATLACGVALFVMSRDDSVMPARLHDLFRTLLKVTAGIGSLQALWGILLFLFGARPGDNLHFVYGGIVLLAIPVAYVYSDQQQVRRDVIIMSVAALAIVGAAIRALMTGP